MTVSPDHVVYISRLHARAGSPVRLLPTHVAVERALEASGMAYTHLRPNLYMQEFMTFAPEAAGAFPPRTTSRGDPR